MPFSASCSLTSGQPQAALAYFDQFPAHLEREAGLTMTYAALGQLAEAERYLAVIKEALDSDLKERAIYHLIHCYTTLRQPEQALDWLEQALELHLSRFTTPDTPGPRLR